MQSSKVLVVLLSVVASVVLPWGALLTVLLAVIGHLVFSRYWPGDSADRRAVIELKEQNKHELRRSTAQRKREKSKEREQARQAKSLERGKSQPTYLVVQAQPAAVEPLQRHPDSAR
ncbi:hypothetical protein ACWDRR_37180 [Kitasatospora sp. NPDC003701]